MQAGYRRFREELPDDDDTIRVRLLKIGAALLRNTRRVRVMLASHHPLRELFATAARRLAALGP